MTNYLRYIFSNKNYEAASNICFDAIKKSSEYREKYVDCLLKCISVSKNKIFEDMHNKNKIRKLQNKIEELMYMPGE